VHVPNPVADSPLARLARRCLDDLSPITDEFVSRVRIIPPYDQEMVDYEQLRNDAEESLELIIRMIGGLPLPERLEYTSDRIGRERARLGVPLQALLQAVRLDVQVVWSTFLTLAEEEEHGSLLHAANLVWEAVEQHTIQIQAGYLAEEALVAREHHNRTGQLLHKLLATQGREPQVVRQVHTALRARPDGRWVVARGRFEHAVSLQSEAHTLRLRGVAAHAQEVAGWPLLLAQLPPGADEPPPRWLAQVPCGVALAESLEGVPGAAEVALAVAAVLQSGAERPHRIREVWAELVVERLADLRGVFTAEILRQLQTVPVVERERLVETALTYFRTGTVAATGQAMYCHRNTVLNRINRLHELTGFDITVPAEAAPVLLALTAADT
jgi:hypothetical protein